MGSSYNAGVPRSPRSRDLARNETRLVTIPLVSVDASPSNPRANLRAINELAASIAAYGLLQPLVVRPAGQRFTLVAGHRRFAAIQSLGWTHAPAIVRRAGADQAQLLNLVENLQRNNLTPREEAQALEVLVREHGWSTRQVAAAVHRSAAYVSKRLRVFEDPVLAPLVLQQQLSTSAAEELLILEPVKRKALAKTAVDEQWDHARVRAAVRACFESKQRGAHVHGLARQLRQSLQGKFPSQLTETDRRELRLLFKDLSALARGSTETQAPIFPRLPLPASGQRHR